MGHSAKCVMYQMRMIFQCGEMSLPLPNLEALQFSVLQHHRPMRCHGVSTIPSCTLHELFYIHFHDASNVCTSSKTEKKIVLYNPGEELV